jgi:acetyl/propionyl-CoA carboxylase alpha subunit
MLAKLIVHAASRPAAIERADRALGEYILLGCQTNAAFLRRLIHDPAFAAGDIHTGFLDANPQLAAEPPLDPDVRARLLAVGCLLSRPMRDIADVTPDLHAALGGWRN